MNAYDKLKERAMAGGGVGDWKLLLVGLRQRLRELEEPAQ